jgi:(1->4)-alpha-D-glucan 1-alpha-D-glucosylmutase
MWQTIVGTWPISTARLTEYLRKVMREAKLHTSWLRVDHRYEAGVLTFAERVLADEEIAQELNEWIARFARPACQISLAQLLLKLTAPGVPDTYQGAELWDLSLADPDNRRPVDFERRRRLLGELAGASCEEILARSEEGLPKLFVLQRALALRKRRPECFGPAASYNPLEVTGADADSLVAFARGPGVVVVVPRLVVGEGASGSHSTVALPPGRFESVFRPGRTVQNALSPSVLLDDFPVILLEEVRPS